MALVDMGDPQAGSLHLVGDGPSGRIDVAAAERAVADLLLALGRDPAAVHLAETPRRVAAAFGVVLEAEHLCMSLRGVRASGSRTVTSAVRGILRTDPRSRAELFALTGVH